MFCHLSFPTFFSCISIFSFLFIFFLMQLLFNNGISGCSFFYAIYPLIKINWIVPSCIRNEMHYVVDLIKSFLSMGKLNRKLNSLNVIVKRIMYTPYFSNKGCPIIIWTMLNIKIGIVQKVYEWPSWYFA